MVLEDSVDDSLLVHQKFEGTGLILLHELRIVHHVGEHDGG
jgi:hypothetical protein